MDVLSPCNNINEARLDEVNRLDREAPSTVCKEEGRELTHACGRIEIQNLFNAWQWIAILTGKRSQSSVVLLLCKQY